MEYAINRVTREIESANKARSLGHYLCPVCKKEVNLRSGRKRKPYFAHWPGVGSTDCENFVLSHYMHDEPNRTKISAEKQRMDLQLLIPRKAGKSSWSVELVLPAFSPCRALMRLDVGGGRIQTLDMRGMERRRQVTVELSEAPYRIINFIGEPDPSFMTGLEMECPGLPSFGAAVFSASRRGEQNTYPRIRELRPSGTYAMLWKDPKDVEFPDELELQMLRGRQGWNLAIITIADAPSTECIDWIKNFTNLPITAPSPSIKQLWPFFNRASSVDILESVKSEIALISTERLSVGHRAQGPTVSAQSEYVKHSVEGVEFSPAFFSIELEGAESVLLADKNNLDVQRQITFSLLINPLLATPVVELAFQTNRGDRIVIPLHKKECAQVAVEIRKNGRGLEYLSMPAGALGFLRIDSPEGCSIANLSSGDSAPLHNQNMRLPDSNVLNTLVSAFANPACRVEIDFGGFGYLLLNGFCKKSHAADLECVLSPELRSRIISFIFQLKGAGSATVHAGDHALVNAIFSARPQTSLIPHYRSLIREIIAAGFERHRFEGVTL